MRLWFCSPGCREAADDTPRPWPFPLREGICPICHAPRPAESAYLIARASIDEGYYAFTAHPLIQVGTYQIIEVESAWRVAAWEHLASGLQLGTVEIFDTVDAAAAAVLELSQRRPFQRPTWPLVVHRLRRWQIELSHTTEGDGPADSVDFTLLSRSGKRGFVSVRMTGQARTYSELFSAVGRFFPGRLRAVLADAWTHSSAV